MSPVGPQKSESKKKFLKRCISYLIRIEDKDKKQASAICYSMWDNKKEGKK